MSFRGGGFGTAGLWVVATRRGTFGSMPSGVSATPLDKAHWVFPHGQFAWIVVGAV